MSDENAKSERTPSNRHSDSGSVSNDLLSGFDGYALLNEMRLDVTRHCPFCHWSEPDLNEINDPVEIERLRDEGHQTTCKLMLAIRYERARREYIESVIATVNTIGNLRSR